MQKTVIKFNQEKYSKRVTEQFFSIVSKLTELGSEGKDSHVVTLDFDLAESIISRIKNELENVSLINEPGKGIRKRTNKGIQIKLKINH